MEIVSLMCLLVPPIAAARWTRSHLGTWAAAVSLFVIAGIPLALYLFGLSVGSAYDPSSGETDWVSAYAVILFLGPPVVVGLFLIWMAGAWVTVKLLRWNRR